MMRSHLRLTESTRPTSGWSVLVQGSLRHLAEDRTLLEAHVGPESWIAEGRTSWLAIVPARITGRRLVAATLQWAFHQSASVVIARAA